jgi:hypothetical protein
MFYATIFRMQDWWRTDFRILSCRKRIVFLLGVVLIVSGVVHSSPAQNPPAGTDFQQMRNDIEIFEVIVSQALGQLFPNPLALVERVKGFYLSDAGVVVVFGVNIRTAITETPFGTITRPETADPKKREQKIVEMKERLMGILADYANAINQLKDGDTVSIVAYIVDPNFTQVNRNKTIILRILKRDLMAKASRQIELTEFKKRIRTIEY